MDMRSARTLMTKTTKGLFAGAFMATALWAIAVSTDWLDIPHRPAGGGQESFARDIDAYIAVIDEDTVKRATMGRAVFRTNRSVPEKVVDGLGRYELRGVSQQEGIRKAYVRDTRLKKTLIKKEGDMMGSFEVITIESSSVSVRRGDEVLKLEKR